MFRLALAWVAGMGMAADETLVASGAACRYRVPTSGVDGTDWTARAFNDASWSLGNSGLGYDTGDLSYVPLFGATVPPGTVSFYARFAFAVQNATNYSSLTLRVKYDDGFIAYLNGAEVARANAPANAGHNSVAASGHDDSQALVYQDFDLSSFVSRLAPGTNVLAIHALNLDSSGDMLILPELQAGLPEVVTNLVINEFMALNNSTIKNSLGKYEDWIELYNPNVSSVSLRGWYLTDDAGNLKKWKFPTHAASSIPGKGYLLVWADENANSMIGDELHASFKLAGDGEYVALVKADGVTVVSAYAPIQQYDDMSYGIGLTGEHRYFTVATPGAGNAFSSPRNEVAEVKFSPKRGVFPQVVPPVTARCDTTGSQIRYTTKAKPPTVTSALYTNPFVFANTAIIRAAGFKSGWAPSGIDTHSYIVLNDVLNQSATPPSGYPTNWAGYAADYGMDPTIVSGSRAALKRALTFLPTLSLVTPQANLFAPATGIYVNPGGRGDEWERPASAEWIEADNTSTFQTDCGLRIQGGYFREMDVTRKKSLMLQFRRTYGEGRLHEDLFSGNAVNSFNDLSLRAGANDAWNGWGQERTQYIGDEFVRRTHLAMGGVSSHGRFVHLYLNGLYWGLYNLVERVSGDFAAAYCGGRADTWDLISQAGVEEGDGAAWDAMDSVLADNQGSNETYQRVQGNNPDGTRNPAYPVYLDVGNYIDYMLVEYWSANIDWPWNNWRAFRDRNDAVSTGFKFAVWDAEAGLGTWGDLGSDVTDSADGVAVIQSRLAGNAEYRLRFADHVQKHLFNGGPLSQAVTIPRYQALAAEIEPAVIAESARWGDQDGGASHTVAEWRAMRDYVLNTFLPQRPAEFMQQLIKRGLYPAVDAPVFSCFGVLFANRLNLAMTAAEPVYYTLDNSDPRQYGTGAAVGTLYTNSVALTRTARVKARARSAGGEWSALTETVFTLAEKPDLRVTELMYHPRRPVAVGGEGYLDGEDEFIELQNVGAAPVGLAGLHFTQGIAFDFTEGAVPVLNSGDYVLVVRNIAAFTNRYPTVPAQRIAGAFSFPSTSLDNVGEKIAIEDAAGRTVVSFTYNNSWLVATDGAGHSLVPLPGVAQADGELDYPGNWKASVYIGGSPGQAEPAAPAASLVLNEILAHTDPDNDWVELYNTTAAPITLGAGWYLSDEVSNLAKWQIPAASVIAAYGWRWWDEITGFHTNLVAGFGLDKAGEQVLLSYLPGAGTGGLDRVVDAVSFRGEENGAPLVRYPDGAASWFDGVPTPGASNRLAAAGVVIDEVMYHPAPTVANPENNENDEYVELHNPTAQAIGFTNIVHDVGGAWRLAGGIGYLFPSNTVLPAGGRLVVVSFDPATNSASRAAFLAAYGLTNGQIRLAGPYSGHLDNQSDTVRLERPVLGDPPAPLDAISWHVIDQVWYYDAAPWPPLADGAGRSLQRRPLRGWGNEPVNWTAALRPTPGARAAKIVLCAPTNGAVFRMPLSVAVAAEVDTNWVAGAVQAVDFYDGTNRLCSDTNAPYGFTLSGSTAPGVHMLKAILIDGEGSNASPRVAITVPDPANETTLTVMRTAGGTVAPGGTLIVTKGAATALVATPLSGYAFANWTVMQGAAAIANREAASTAIAISAPATILANFTAFRCKGGTVTNDTSNGTNFTIHIFTEAGTTNINVTGAGTVDVYAWGGGGGGQTAGSGGGGGAAHGTVTLVPGTYAVVVGGGGQCRDYPSPGGPGDPVPGGGGLAAQLGGSGQGGGFSGIFSNSPRQANAMLIAGAGGGGGYAGDGGAGGGTSGSGGSGSNPGGGGTQSAGGAGGNGTSGPGSPLQGGTAGRDGDQGGGGGGGGGYYGGGAGYNGDDPAGNSGGGGGSAYYNPTRVSSATLTAGSGATPGDSSNPLRGSAGSGGAQGNAGAQGIVIIRYVTPAVDSDLPSIENRPATNVTATSATLKGYLSSTGSAATAVWVYWGGTDQTTSAARWDYTNFFGTNTVGAKTYTTNTAAMGMTLAKGAIYYYNFYAQNASGVMWATTAGSQRFITLGNPVVTLSAPTAIGESTGTINGTLTSDGGYATTVYLCWGTNDCGDASTSAWPNVAGFGTKTSGQSASTNLTGLLWGLRYWYRAYATNADGDAWSAATNFVTLAMPGEAYVPGLCVRAWKNGDNVADLDSARYNLASPSPAPNDTTAAGTIGYATESIDMNGDDAEHFGAGRKSGVPDSSTRPTGYGDQYCVEYRGNLLVSGGTYCFATTSDDGSSLWIDPATDNPSYSTATVQNDGWQGMTARSSSQIALSAGYHDIIVRHYEGGGENGLQVQWDPAGGTSWTAIPGANFFHLVAGAATTAGITNTGATAVQPTQATLNGTLMGTNAYFEVWAYWGETDGTNNPAAWTHSSYVGAFTLTDGTISSNIAYTVSSGIGAKKGYWYTFRATNAATNVWASPSRRFGRPIVTVSAATGIGVGKGTIRGKLVSDGGDTTTVYLCWGTTDFRSFATSDWPNVVGFGTKTGGESVFTNLTGLISGRRYWYRAYAINAAGVGWSSPTNFLTGGGGGNQAPTINTPAWADPNPVTPPAGTTVHVGASDPDGDPITYLWSKVSGPGTATFAAPAAADSGVSFSAAGRYVLRVTVSDNRGGSATSDVTVTAPLPGTISFDASSYVALEGTTLKAGVKRSQGAAGTVSVQYWMKPKTALAWQDYTPKSGTLTWTDGQTASKMIKIPIRADGQAEGNETFQVMLTAPVGATLVAPFKATVTITGNNKGGAVDGDAVSTRMASLADAVDAEELTWFTAPLAAWTKQAGVTADGVDAAVSGASAPDQVSWLQADVEGPGTLDYDWLVRGRGLDAGLLIVDGRVFRTLGSGFIWTHETIPVEAGVHAIRWVFAGESRLIQGAAYLDRVSWKPGPLAP